MGDQMGDTYNAAITTALPSPKGKGIVEEQEGGIKPKGEEVIFSPALPQNLTEEEKLAQKLGGIGLGSANQKETNNSIEDGFSNSRSYPLRPYAEDCPHFIRTGVCKFGPNCRFNHPFKRTYPQVVQEKDKHMVPEDYSPIECKYYLTEGGCKYGQFCKYTHYKNGSLMAGTELNLLGLPIRWGEKECPFYMRTGSCGYGATCVFHHPDPSSYGGPNFQKSAHNDMYAGQSEQFSRDSLGGSVHSGSSGISQQQQVPRSSYMPSNDAVFYQDNSYSYFSPADSIREGIRKYIALNEAAENRQKNRRLALAAGGRSNIAKTNNATQVEEYPQRPDQPVCDDYMKTGVCNNKAECCFHHPKNRILRSDTCALSEKGLPLRPGKEICQHYGRFGICKYGRACLYDHPLDHIPWIVSQRRPARPAHGPGAGTRRA